MGGEITSELLELKIQMAENYRPALEAMILDKMKDQAPCFITHMTSGTILFATRRVNEIFGYIHNEIENKNVSDLLPERFREKHVKHLMGFSKSPHTRQMGSSHEQVLLGLTKDGKEFRIKISLEPFFQNSVGYVFATLMNVSDERTV